jgi:hypothetical protein
VEGAALPSALLSARRAAEDATLSEVYSYVRVQVSARGFWRTVEPKPCPGGTAEPPATFLWFWGSACKLPGVAVGWGRRAAGMFVQKSRGSILRDSCPWYRYSQMHCETPPYVAQTDIRLPKRWACRTLPDGYRWGRWAEAVAAALRQLAQAVVAAPRVLVLGCGGGMLPLIALRAGAAHVTCAERWAVNPFVSGPSRVPRRAALCIPCLSEVYARPRSGWRCWPHAFWLSPRRRHQRGRGASEGAAHPGICAACVAHGKAHVPSTWGLALVSTLCAHSGPRFAAESKGFRV